MEEQLQKRKSQTKKELPEEIIHDEILTRLPHEYLLRFRSVCKPWLTLFSDPQFIKLHVRRNACSNQNYIVNSVYMSELKIISRSKETRINTASFINNSFLIGSVNGLICFASPQVVTLWNPAIRQYKELRTTHVHDKICEELVTWSYHQRDCGASCVHLYGFGWDPSGNDYKLVVVCYPSPDLKYASVYSSKSDSWTQLVLPTNIFGVKSRSFIKSPCPAVIVKECPYWSHSKYLRAPGKSYKRRHTVVFKFVSEKNEFKLLPDFDLVGKQELKLCNLKDRLVGMTYKSKYPFNTRFMDLYSLDHEGSGGVWSKMYTLGAMDSGLLFRDKVGIYRKLKQLYCFESKTKKVHDVVDAAPFRLEHFTHTPSLGFVYGMKNIMHTET